MDKITLLSAEITKAYKLAHRDVPKMDDVRLEAGMMIKDCSCIPEGFLGRCYTHARIHGRSSVPTSKDVVNAWYSDIKGEYTTEANTRAVEYKPKHECKYCNVVALRLGLVAPDSTELEINASKEPVTNDEIMCVLSTMDDSIIRHWNESPKSPYRGML